ncbi:hypothetical protein ACPOL_3393 [Acidisarcina polymorpha]|uniref:Uncharacterized protein n=1 Tax=Acidisarcina polymorpha TaxID=2211140 RepID=A0A2Z5G0Z9_9BACT|nr:hypothetical protein [Acidisarcina polymorpha]AXC12680.1 hypothetical protein ACPOL_3393 [Acidisarcina polymorpha]
MDIANFIVAGVAMVAAIIAAYFAWKAPSKEDLARVEAYTAESAKHIAEQTKRDLIAAIAEHVSITVNGRSTMIEDMPVRFDLKDPGVTLVKADLLNHLGTLSGTIEC